ncbi:MAG: glutamate--tRNA ligase [Candidatus Shapirobacteria bacterium]|jgi:glutamyl-tRNA synthetase
MADAKVIRTRMAPSPTGDIHIGTLRTGLYAYALAKQNEGQFILRIEDTDQKRLVRGAAERTLKVFRDYGLIYDEGPDVGGPFGPYVQTERLAIYQKYIQELLLKKLAYHCFCTPERLDEMRTLQKAAKKIPKYDRHCLALTPDEINQKIENGQEYVIRLRIPDNETIVFNDLIHGEIKFNTNDLDDQVLIKSNGIPTYHFAVVVDDHLMEISHIIRSDEWISSTPKHIILYRYFGWDVPLIAHLTVLLDPTHPGKMSKRYGSVFAQQFIDEGYLPEAMLNFLMLLGWNPGTDRELFTLQEFVSEFSISHLHKKAAIFDRKKLDYFNGIYLRKKSNEELSRLFKKFLPQANDNIITALIPILKERIVKLKDLVDQTKFLFEDIKYEPALLMQRGLSKDLAVSMLTEAKNLLSQVELFEFSVIQEKLMNLIKTNNWNTGQFFMVFRVAICGVVFTPPVVDCLPILGKENTLRKINLALAKLEK